MRFDLLHFVRYGSLSDVTLSFSTAGPGFHLIYGSNEAGKSTALRAIRGLLFGIPERTPDRHLHGNDLWLRAVVRAEDGHTLEVQRRRGRRATLRDAENAPMPEAQLRRLLPGVDAELFSNLFGLDHVSLRRGAEALLFDRGAVGEALFEVGLGGGSVTKVLQEVRAEADAIFLPRGTKRQLNAELESFREAHRRVHASALHADDYAAQARAVADAEEELSRLRARRKALAEERGRLQRIAAVVVPLGERKRLEAALSELSHVRLLPPDAREARLTASETVTRTAPERKQLAAQRDAVASRLDGLQIPEALVDLGDEVQALRDQLGSHRKAAQDLPRRRQELKSMQAEARSILRRLGGSASLKDVERRRLSRPQVVRVRELSRRSAAVQQGVEQAQDALLQAQAAEAAAAEETPAPEAARLSTLRDLLQAYQRLGDPVERRDALLATLTQRRSALRAAVAGLVPAVPPEVDMAAWPLPGQEAVRSIAAETDAVAQKQATAERDAEAQRRRLNGAQKELSALAGGSHVPTEADLLRAREDRDTAVSALLSDPAVTDARAAESTPAPPQARGTEVKALVREADAVSDRLRWEAATVSKVSHLQAEIADAQAELARLGEVLAALAEARTAQAQRLQALFAASGVTPLSPGAMVEWLKTLQGLRVEALAVQHAEEELEVYDRRLTRLAAGFAAEIGDAAALPDHPDGHAVAQGLQQLARSGAEQLERARQTADARQRWAERREQRRAQRLAAEAKLQRHLEASEAWRKEWSAMMGHLRLPQDATVDQAEAVLEALDALFDKVDRFEPLRGRIEGMERDRDEFERAVRRMSDRYLFRLGDVNLEEAAEELSRAHARARRDLEERQRLSRELGSLQARLDEVTLEHERATATLAQLCRRAGVEDVEALEAAERASERHAGLGEELARIESQIRAAGQGLSFEALQAEAADWSPDRAAARLQELELEAHALDRDLERTSRELAQAEEARRRLMGKQGAAAAASDAAASAEKARTLVERYVRLRLAERFLSQEVERYRKRYQAPLLERATAIFAGLTAGRYEGLAVDYARGDQPALCAVREGQRVGVEGLSDGTRDQLYLALRLATLHEHVTRSEPMPLVLDDVLVHFDDERARAALEVLGDFAAVTQVLFFTHHARLRELAGAVIDGEVLRVHRLERTPAVLRDGAPC